nr:PHB depolymerase family esterase [Chryseolinea sp.]
MKILKKINLTFIASVFLCVACDDNNIVPTAPVVTNNTVASTNQVEIINGIPVDIGGTHKPYVLGSTAAKYGYYLYRPSGYSTASAKYPLLIFLHGQGERGDGTNSLTVLNKVLNTGIPKLIKDKKWNPTNPMLVVSPQYFDATGVPTNWGGGNPEVLKEFIKYMIDHYRVDPRRIYLTGLSAGGNGIWDYLS